MPTTVYNMPAASNVPSARVVAAYGLESTTLKVWTFDQLQGILYVIVPVRMTVIKLDNSEGGGLFVYAPVAPTGECMAMMRKLEAEHGPVRHIVLGTLGLEHKVFAGPFAQRFSEASVWFTPGQYRCVFFFSCVSCFLFLGRFHFCKCVHAFLDAAAATHKTVRTSRESSLECFAGAAESRDAPAVELKPLAQTKYEQDSGIRSR